MGNHLHNTIQTDMSHTVLLLLASALNINEAGRQRGPASPQFSGDVRHKVKMGEANVNCDDGNTNLAVDWLDSPLNFTCYHPTPPLQPPAGEGVRGAGQGLPASTLLYGHPDLV